ncbi:unnamed protein product [Ixodes pacificus]
MPVQGTDQVRVLPRRSVNARPRRTNSGPSQSPMQHSRPVGALRRPREGDIENSTLRFSYPGGVGSIASFSDWENAVIFTSASRRSVSAIYVPTGADSEIGCTVPG